MKVNLLIFPSFLRTSFAKTRLHLVGNEYGDRSSKKSFLMKAVNSFLLTISISSLLAAGLLMLPDVYYRVFPADTAPIVALESGTPLGGRFDDETQAQQAEDKIALPEKNESLPEGNWLIIPRIGVRTQLKSTQNPTEALKQGVWMAPSYGQPGDEYDLPIILAAHRFGWDWWWQTDYWKYNSFYNLPDLEPGDMVEMIVDQRKWTYEIYGGDQGEEITDYEANLILYTCKFLNSPLRYFRYARLVDLEHNTQS
jgi:sortase (surface protein transpeptidase)